MVLGIASRSRNRDCYLPFALLLGGVILGSGKAVDLPTLKALTPHYLALLPRAAGVVKRGLIFMVTVPSEAVGERLAGRLERMGYHQLQLQRTRVMLHKYWRVAGLSGPVEYTVAEIHRWLDSIDSVAREYGAALETWVPTE
ncbi:MAG: hypothetical protein ACREN6_07905 [Gemmatimonadaceae bacterium]